MIWYEDEVKRVEKSRDNCSYQPQTIFYGSSSIRLWESLYLDFKDYKPLNLGFGGSTLAACVWFFDRILTPIKDPKHFIIYAGDNDLGDNRSPEEVFIFYQQLIYKFKQHFNGVACGFISIKPSPNRWNILSNIQKTNMLIKSDIESRNNGIYFINIFDKMVDKNGYPRRDLFEYDGLHLNAKGYQIWKDTLLAHSSFHS